jgi:hypothetical protein
MTYTIKIQDKSLKAKSIINMLKALKDDYDFIDIQKDDSQIFSFNQDKELNKRYKSFQKSPKGKDWLDLKKEFK